MFEEEKPAKRFKADDEKLSKFVGWLKESGFYVNEKVEIVKTGSRDRYGMIAKEEIDEQEKLFIIPREMTLCAETSGIKDILDEAKENLASDSGWVPLLLALNHEYFNPTSKWRPYLDIVDLSHLDLPIFWDRAEIKRELKGTGLNEAVESDLARMKNEYEKIVLPFMKSNPDKFDAKCQDFELYKKLVSFVMAYSFATEVENPPQDDSDDNDSVVSSEPDEIVTVPVMVPLADILNHIARNNSHLEFEDTKLNMLSTRKIKKSEEVFNTYGEISGFASLFKYGFVEPYPENVYEVVEISNTFFIDTLCNINTVDQDLWKLKWAFLKNEGLIFSSGCFTFNEVGVENEFQLFATLKVYHMSKTEFEAAKRSRNEFKEEDYSNFDDDFFANIEKRSRDLLRTLFTARLAQYPGDADEEELKLVSLDKLASRSKWSLLLRVSHRRLLNKLLKNLTEADSADDE